jgi:tetratricopeptide (TPR) repeat protein
MRLFQGSPFSASSDRPCRSFRLSTGSLLKLPLLIAFLTALITEPLHAQAGAERGWGCFYKKQYEEAIGHFEGELRNRGKDFWVIDGVGWCRFYLGDLDRAEADFRKALSIRPDYSFSAMGIECVAAARRAPIEEAEGFLAEGRPGEARIAFEAALREAPRLAKDLEVRALSGLGRAHHTLGDYSDAARAFQGAVKLDSRCAPAHAGHGYALMARKKYKNAASSLEKALSLVPGNLDARLAHAWCAYHGRNTAAALKRFTAICRDCPDCYGALLGLGWCRAKKGETGKACARFSEALILAPEAATVDLLTWIEEDRSRPALRVDYAFALVALGRDSEARRLLQSVDTGDDLPVARLGEALAALHLGENEEALRLARSLVEEGIDPIRELHITSSAGAGTRLPVSISASSVLGWSLLALGAYDEAADSFTRAACLDEVRPDAMSGLGSVRLAEERYDEAVVHFNAALNFLPDYPPAVTGLSRVTSWSFSDYNRAWTLLEAGEITAARKIFRSLRNDQRKRFPASRDDLIDFSLGHAACRAGDHVEAISLFQEALRRNPALAAALSGLGRAHIEAGNPRVALPTLEKAIAALPLDPVPRRLKAEALVAIDRRTDALEALSRWTATFVDAGLFELQGRLLIEETKFVEARIVLETAFLLDPDRIVDSEVEEWIRKWRQFNSLAGTVGRIRYDEGRFADALRWHTLALEKEPGDQTHHREIALAAAALGRIDEAEKSAEVYFASLDDSYRGHTSRRSISLVLGWTFYAGLDFESALRIFREVEKRDGSCGRRSADVQNALGWAWLGSGNILRAKSSFLDALALEPWLESALTGLEEAIAAHSR